MQTRSHTVREATVRGRKRHLFATTWLPVDL